MIEHIQVIPDKCRACRRCEVACIAAHHGMTFKEAMKHRDVLVSRVQVVKAEGFRTTVRCHQCNPAPCCNICPTGALQQEEDGRITMRVQLCIACKLCIAACPYGTISLDTIGMPDLSGDDAETMAQRSRREVAVRCDMCRAWREENGKKITACMEACPVRALSMVEPDGTVVEAPIPVKKPAEPEARPEKAARIVAPSKELAEQAARDAAGAREQPAKPQTRPLPKPEGVISRPAVPATEAVIAELLQAFSSASELRNEPEPEEGGLTPGLVAEKVAADVESEMAAEEAGKDAARSGDGETPSAAAEKAPEADVPAEPASAPEAPKAVKPEPVVPAPEAAKSEPAAEATEAVKPEPAAPARGRSGRSASTKSSAGKTSSTRKTGTKTTTRKKTTAKS
ncbi:4Fe-4S dicluster domain-containing protein [uncultured Desulfovibrio sp.]|uniref:4Fe-4S dicluster domain-containing protein n=2 Tax=Desulfovibrio TaxID=872 RepID=UPI002631959B|nr:4Fe-4S dicluster domain-containing protein [uncultured Desulfovibrio sp.]